MGGGEGEGGAKDFLRKLLVNLFLAVTTVSCLEGGGRMREGKGKGNKINDYCVFYNWYLFPLNKL